jgi:hypothetical protein
MEKKIGICQRISINVMEMAMNAAIKGIFTPEYATDLALGEFHGENIIGKVKTIIGRLTLRNPLFSFIEEHQQEYFMAIKHKGDRAIIFSSLINAAYPFGYDTLTILGKFFHVQDEVSTQLLLNKLSSIYASNKTMPNGLYCVMPMYIDAGLLSRPKAGVYKKNELEIVTEFAQELYKKSFFVNNPLLDEEDYDYLEHPYFEFMS